jgi:hypothetical protein
LQRVHVNSTDPETEIFGDVDLEDKLREWASFRGQTLSRTGILTMLGCNACLLAFAFSRVVHLLVQLNTNLERLYIDPSDHLKGLWASICVLAVFHRHVNCFEP